MIELNIYSVQKPWSTHSHFDDSNSMKIPQQILLHLIVSPFLDFFYDPIPSHLRTSYRNDGCVMATRTSTQRARSSSGTKRRGDPALAVSLTLASVTCSSGGRRVTSHEWKSRQSVQRHIARVTTHNIHRTHDHLCYCPSHLIVTLYRHF